MSDAQRSTNTVVTVRGLSIELKGKLRVRAAHNARSMEAEARAILERALMAPEEDAIDLATFARSLFKPLGGAELELPGREPMREPPPLSDLATDIPATRAVGKDVAAPALQAGNVRPPSSVRRTRAASSKVRA